jgi:hypothetical protein
MLKTKIMKHQERDKNNLREVQHVMPSADPKSKIMIHKRITKTFVKNTPEQSQEKIKIHQQLPVR